MPTKDQHLQKAKGNENFATSIRPDDQTRIDWVLVILFYAAVHYVEAYMFKTFSMHLRSHATRDHYVGRESNLRKIFSNYQQLKYYAYNARYECGSFTLTDMADANKDLADLKSAILPLL